MLCYFLFPCLAFAEFVGELGAENKVLEDSRFTAFDFKDFFGDGRYAPKDGRLNSYRPWGTNNKVNYMWFKVDLGKVMLVNGFATQGDSTYGPCYFPDYKLEFALESTGNAVVLIKEEGSSSVKVIIIYDLLRTLHEHHALNPAVKS